MIYSSCSPLPLASRPLHYPICIRLEVSRLIIYYQFSPAGPFNQIEIQNLYFNMNLSNALKFKRIILPENYPESYNFLGCLLVVHYRTYINRDFDLPVAPEIVELLDLVRVKIELNFIVTQAYRLVNTKKSSKNDDYSSEFFFFILI